MYLAFAAGGALVTAVVVIAQAILLGRVVTAVFLHGAGLVGVGPLLLLFAAVIAVRALLGLANQLAGRRYAGRVQSRLRLSLLRKSLDRGAGFPGGERTGELVNTATRGVDALEPYYARYIPELALASVIPPLAILWVFFLDPLSAVILAVAVPLVPVFAALVGLAARARAEKQWHRLSLLSAHYLDVVEGLTTLKVFGRSRLQLGTIRSVSDSYRQATMSSLRIAFLSALVLELAATMGTALVAVAVGIRLAQGGLTLDAGLPVLILVPEIFLPLRRVGSEFHASAEGVAAADRIFAVVGTGGVGEPEVDGAVATAGAAHDLRRETIRLQGLSVAYPRRHTPVLHRVDLTIRPGERIALMGPSGSGKSTLLGVLLGLVEPSAGCLTAGDHDAGPIDLPSWRDQVGWLPQRAFVFHGTIRDNVRVGEPGADAATVMEALDWAGLGGWVRTQPGGIDTEVGEKGERLSAGQRRRLCLARALVRKAPVLLLDEPTANLDGLTAAEVRACLRVLPWAPTLVCAVHEPELAHVAERVLWLPGDGSLSESAPPSPEVPASAIADFAG